jgi:hypothetical protein
MILTRRTAGARIRNSLRANFGQGEIGADVAVSQADMEALDSFAIANGLPRRRSEGSPNTASADCFHRPQRLISSPLNQLAFGRASDGLS